jgi:hypothetical protein
MTYIGDALIITLVYFHILQINQLTQFFLLIDDIVALSGPDRCCGRLSLMSHSGTVVA